MSRKRQQDSAQPPIVDEITERHVREWGRRLVAEARASRHSLRRLPTRQLAMLEQSFALLLDEKFRADFNSAEMARRQFLASDPLRGRDLLRRWGVIEVIRPHWIPELRRFSLLAPFHIPIVHWTVTTGGEALEGPALNIRILLQRQWTTCHPQYVLACRLCGWLQGELARPETWRSPVPVPHEQAAALLWSRREPSMAFPPNSPTHMAMLRGKRSPHFHGSLLKEFSEEIWGFDAVQHVPHGEAVEGRQPRSGDIGRLFDDVLGLKEVFGVWWVPPSWLRPPERWLRALGWLLDQLECQVCARSGGLRYLIRFLSYTDVDQSQRSSTAATALQGRVLKAVRTDVLKDKLLTRVFWLPPDTPDPTPLGVASRIQQELTARKAPTSRRKATPRQVSGWMLRSAHAGRPFWQARIEEAIGVPPDREDLYDRLSDLFDAIVSRTGGGPVGREVGSAWATLSDPAFSEVKPLIIRYYESKILRRVLSKARSKAARVKRL